MRLMGKKPHPQDAAVIVQKRIVKEEPRNALKAATYWPPAESPKM
jgi:hypothetical protein